MKDPWRGRLLLVEPDVKDGLDSFIEDLAAAGLETIEMHLAFEAWADQRGDS